MGFIKENCAIVVFLIYLVIINIVGFAIMGIDKSKAKKGKWRIPEKTLFAIAIIGGSIGTNLGMKHFRHKTAHKTFVYGMPAILIFQIIMVVLCIVQMVLYGK
jgi:uncharacterized membrane protein YsdA (DUF1294 family)